MDVTQALLTVLDKCDEYHEALGVVSKNSSGKIWLIGGFVYRTIASQLYGLPKPEVDLDFIVKESVEEFDLPGGWIVKRSRFGNPKFVNGHKQIDYVPLDNIYSILYRDLEPTIENFLSGNPLTIQALAFDISDNRVIGDLGIKAIKERTIAVLDIHFARYAAEKKGRTLDTYIQEKAIDMRFTPIFP